ncbi:MAG: cyclic nucleotide-binding domain-containing protein [Bdellovibrionales bacterium]|nr:cyclic nucleotide-binding domain-containing protein [Bdellovibrionales bacterium]
MQFKKIEAGAYDNERIAVRNPQTGHVALLSEGEFRAYRYMEENPSESFLGLLMPSVGIAKREHIKNCLSAIAKLKKVGLVDVPSLDPRIKSNTGTMELEISREKIRFDALDSMAATLGGVLARMLAGLGHAGVFVFTALLAALCLVFFPFHTAEQAALSGVSYSSIFVGTLVFMGLALSWRSVTRAAFIKGSGHDIDAIRFSLLGPVVHFHTESSAAWLLGVRGRFLLALTGALAPLAFCGLFVPLHLIGKISLGTIWLMFGSSVASILAVSCPLLKGDGAEILDILLNRFHTKASSVRDAKDILLQKVPGIPKSGGVALLTSIVWYLIYLDLGRSYWEVWSTKVLFDLVKPEDTTVWVGAMGVAAVFALLALFPIAAVVALLVKGVLEQRKKRKFAPLPLSATDDIDFEDQMTALEKVPLFAALRDDERLALFNEMQLVKLKDGEHLVRQGEVGDEFFVLIRGHAKASFRDTKGTEHVVNELGEGDAFGEISLLDDVPRTASIVCQGGCHALRLKKAGFEKVVLTMGSSERVKQMIRLSSFFRRHPLFSRLTPKEQAELISEFHFDLLAPGEEVIHDETGENFYVVYSGVLHVDTGDDATDTTIEPDDCFGYAAGMSARIVARDGAGLLKIRKGQFDTLIWQKLVERPELFL